MIFQMWLNIQPSSVKIYAEDIPLNNPRAQANLQDDLSRVCQWMEANDLKISDQKCAHLRIGAAPNLSIYSNGNFAIPFVETFKDLGIYVDSDLNFSGHMTKTIGRANRTSRVIWNSFYQQNTDFRVQMFKTFVRPILEFATSVWSPFMKGNIKDIERVQRGFTKYLPGMDMSHIENDAPNWD